MMVSCKYGTSSELTNDVRTHLRVTRSVICPQPYLPVLRLRHPGGLLGSHHSQYLVILLFGSRPYCLPRTRLGVSRASFISLSQEL